MSKPGNQAKLDAAEALANVAEKAGITLIDLALAFVINHPAVTSAIIGPRTMEHFESQIGAADVTLNAEILDQIDEIVPPGQNLLADDAGYDPPSITQAWRRRRPKRD
jgi:aryl-alcohol dehydrogenase-like predicted oxidoreductase